MFAGLPQRGNRYAVNASLKQHGEFGELTRLGMVGFTQNAARWKLERSGERASVGVVGMRRLLKLARGLVFLGFPAVGPPL